METILAIDDSAFNIHTLTSFLQNDYHIISAQSGKEGIQLAMQHLPTLILLDIEMPEMNGFEVLEELQKNERVNRIPVIFLTGLANIETEEKALLAGAVDYITKPYNQNIVKARVRTHVDSYLYQKTIENELLLDVLTGLHNRRSYESFMLAKWNDALVNQAPLSIAMIDIDYFKNVNDTYGHQEGDRILKMVSSTILSALPKYNNYVARYGGDEFVIILPNVYAEEAEQIVNKVCQNVFDQSLPNIHSKVCDVVTISIGGATIIPNECEYLLNFINSADEMLYKAKAFGRNQVIWKK
ncbi:MAG: diguanylate cyclase [Anaerovorax sp.]|nr:diguanylate cyclase [Anaerovorax sp.]